MNHFFYNFFGIEITWIICWPIIHFFKQFFMTFISHKNMKMRRTRWIDFMITELYEFWCSISIILRTEQISNSFFSRCISQNLESIVLILCREFFISFFKNNFTSFSIDFDFADISGIAREIILFVFLGGFACIWLLSLVFHNSIKRPIKQIWIERLPAARIIRERSIHNCRVFKNAFLMRKFFMCVFAMRMFMIVIVSMNIRSPKMKCRQYSYSQKKNTDIC